MSARIDKTAWQCKAHRATLDGDGRCSLCDSDQPDDYCVAHGVMLLRGECADCLNEGQAVDEAVPPEVEIPLAQAKVRGRGQAGWSVYRSPQDPKNPMVQITLEGETQPMILIPVAQILAWLAEVELLEHLAARGSARAEAFGGQRAP